MRALFLSLGALFLLAGPSIAGTHDEAVIALHVHTTCDKCAVDLCGTHSPNAAPGLSCSSYDVDHLNTHAGCCLRACCSALYILVARADSASGVSAVNFGIEADSSVALEAWSTCADEDFPVAGINGDWPASGSANRLTWDQGTNCQRTVIGDDAVQVVAGVLGVYAYGDGEIRITPNMTGASPEFQITDCSGVTTDLTTPGGRVGFGALEGFNPCVDVQPVETSTWGKIKDQYRKP